MYRRYLILVILLQTGKGAGIGAAFGGGSQTVFGPRGAGSFIGKVTGTVAALFMLTSIILAYQSTSRSGRVAARVEALETVNAEKTENVELGTLVTRKDGGVYYEKSKRIVAVPGAMVAWRFGKGGRKGHAAVLAQDLGPDGEPNGYLDEHDLVLHTMWESPVLEPISEVFSNRDPVAVIEPVGK